VNTYIFINLRQVNYEVGVRKLPVLLLHLHLFDF
jgi:hypothetical protein